MDRERRTRSAHNAGNVLINGISVSRDTGSDIRKPCRVMTRQSLSAASCSSRSTPSAVTCNPSSLRAECKVGKVRPPKLDEPEAKATREPKEDLGSHDEEADAEPFGGVRRAPGFVVGGPTPRGAGRFGIGPFGRIDAVLDEAAESAGAGDGVRVAPAVETSLDAGSPVGPDGGGSDAALPRDETRG